jgi:hypothetical protein
LRKLFGRDVYIEREGWIGRKKRLPGTELPGSVVKQLAINRQDESGLVCNRDEFSRHDQTFGTLPATEGLEPYDLAVEQ